MKYGKRERIPAEENPEQQVRGDFFLQDFRQHPTLGEMTRDIEATRGRSTQINAILALDAARIMLDVERAVGEKLDGLNIPAMIEEREIAAEASIPKAPRTFDANPEADLLYVELKGKDGAYRGNFGIAVYKDNTITFGFGQNSTERESAAIFSDERRIKEAMVQQGWMRDENRSGEIRWKLMPGRTVEGLKDYLQQLQTSDVELEYGASQIDRVTHVPPRGVTQRPPDDKPPHRDAAGLALRMPPYDESAHDGAPRQDYAPRPPTPPSAPFQARLQQKKSGGERGGRAGDGPNGPVTKRDSWAE